MIRVNQYTIFDNYEEFENYWYSLPEQQNKTVKPDIIDIKLSTVSTVEQINGNYRQVLDIDFPDEKSEPIFSFPMEFTESFDLDRGYKIIFDESTNSMLAFEFYEKSDSEDILNILIGPYIGNYFFSYIGKLRNSRK